jgi:hypothetical protein
MTTNEKEPELPPIDEQAQNAIDAVIAANTMQAVFKDEAVMVELLDEWTVLRCEIPETYLEKWDAYFMGAKDCTNAQFNRFYNSLI